MKSLQTDMGQGLAALLGEAALAPSVKEKILMIPIDQIFPNPYQPRQNFSEASLSELADSIREQGVLLPIIVRHKPTFEEAFQLIAGERRWRAAKLAGLDQIPAMFRRISDRQMLEISILENVQREDLNPVEVARGCAQLIEKFGYSHKKAALRIGKSRETITNLLRLLRLPESILALIESGHLSMGHARAMVRLESKPELLDRVAEMVIEQNLSVRQTEELLRTLEQEEAKQVEPGEEGVSVEEEEGSPILAKRRKDPMILSIEERLTETLGTKVSITHLKGKGKVIVEYATLEELEGLADQLLRISE
ncbi:putative chromosome-partitioning protein ParB [Candidatus Magnetaquicoccaceae bacterium FCR-1]|uniref:Chromosome-partitioning protein ParB n=1 Tax=Candidatus Magnetaquiglobus chichijimensis TaxID=3141448 RepID=A0ABQ0CCI1_9PROT